MVRGAVVVLWMQLLLIGLPASTAAAQDHEPPAQRPALLLPLYVTFAGLQAVDVHSTLSATGAGAREANPLMRSALGHPARLVLLKAGTGTAVVLLSERLWRRNRAAALVTMVVLNSAYVTIAAHNYRTRGDLIR